MENQVENDDLYKHLWEEGHNGLRDFKIHLIDRVNWELEQLRDKEGRRAYKLNTLCPCGLNDNIFSLFKTGVQDVRNTSGTCVSARGRVVMRAPM